MSRPIRLQFHGDLYHIAARGDRREAIYEDDADRERFRELLQNASQLTTFRQTN